MSKLMHHGIIFLIFKKCVAKHKSIPLMVALGVLAKNTSLFRFFSHVWLPLHSKSRKDSCVFSKPFAVYPKDGVEIAAAPVRWRERYEWEYFSATRERTDEEFGE